uniref:Uncharacterized protein n=1 Tax=viral metagenome TaxID=1070528 RepID=A0A6C0HWW6_9ZZZZ
MRTRRSRGLKQTRRGGAVPELKTPNTYIIQRHGFSCANLQKAKDKKKNRGVWHAKLTNPSLHARVEDPSLTSYGIYSLLRKEEIPTGFTGTVYGSSLLRTWQTAILIYGKFGPLKIIVSPYIKEKHGFALDLSNMPLPFEQQMAYMEQFMQFLKGIDHEIAREIIRHEHIIEYNGNGYPLGPYTLDLNYTVPEDSRMAAGKFYVDQMKHNKVNLSPHSDESPLKRDALIPNISIREPSFREYYGAEGFVYFDNWVRQRTTAKTIFVVSHSNWMQKVIEQYCGPVVTNIFDENAWKLTIVPLKFKTGANFKFTISSGVPKPQDHELDFMNRAEEPTCQVPRQVTQPVRDAPRAASLPQRSELTAYAQQFAEDESPVNADEALRLQDKYHEDVETPYRASEDPFQAHLPVKSVVDEARPRSSFSTEVTTEPIQSRLVSKEPKVDITRSFTELVYMLSDPGIAQGLSLLIDSPKELKTKVLQFIYSNPSVTETRGMFSRFRSTLYLFQNHYFAFILMYNPFYEALVQRLESGSDMLTHFKITSMPASVIRFFKELRILIDTDTELYQTLLYTFKANANKHYSFEAPPKVYAFTLLDLLLYEMLPLTVEKIRLMYPLFIDLVRNGARFSKTIYSENIVATEVDYPSPVIVPRKMPRSDLKPLLEIEQIALKQQWEEAKRRLDPTNELSQLNEQFRQTKQKLQDLNGKVNRRSTQIQQLLEQQSAILDELSDIKRRYREANTRLDPTQELSKLRVTYREKINENVFDYLFEHLVDYVPLDDLTLRQTHNALLKKIKAPEGELPVSIGGSRGTSWKRTLLRQSSVKAGRYRASLYKGKRRTRANRS